jgi:hypothetical protein
MERHCFNCEGHASTRYTLIFEDSNVFNDKLLCEGCLSHFRNTEWIEVRETPVAESKRNQT